MKTFIYILPILLLASACKKVTSSNEPVSIEGRLMASCDVPAANKSGFIRTDDGLLSGPGISLSFTSDENGYFKITHTGKESLDKFTVRVQGSSDVLRVNHLSGKKKNLGKVYINPFPTNFIIKLDVKNPYTENDTLVMTDFTSSDPFAQKFIPGPFNTGVLDSVVNSFYNKLPISFSDISNHGGPQHSIGVYVRSLPNYYTDLKYEYFHISPICSGEFAEVTLVID